MNGPHVCPVCRGEGRVAAHVERQTTTAQFTKDRPCPACHGACVLWPPYLIPMTFPSVRTDPPYHDLGYWSASTFTLPPQTTWTVS